MAALICHRAAQFNAFLGKLGVETIPTDMSFGLTTADGALEWSSLSISSFVGSLAKLSKPWFWRLVLDIIRFSLFARDILSENDDTPQHGGTHPHDDLVGSVPLEPIGDWLRRQGYTKQFIAHFLVPMVAAPWCIDPDEFAAKFPAKSLIHFM